MTVLNPRERDAVGYWNCADGIRDVESQDSMSECTCLWLCSKRLLVPRSNSMPYHGADQGPCSRWRECLLHERSVTCHETLRPLCCPTKCLEQRDCMDESLKFVYDTCSYCRLFFEVCAGYHDSVPTLSPEDHWSIKIHPAGGEIYLHQPTNCSNSPNYLFSCQLVTRRVELDWKL